MICFKFTVSSGNYPRLPNVNASVEQNENKTYKFNDTILFICEPGFYLRDERLSTIGSRTCLSDGSWSDGPLCEIGRSTLQGRNIQKMFKFCDCFVKFNCSINLVVMSRHKSLLSYAIGVLLYITYIVTSSYQDGMPTCQRIQNACNSIWQNCEYDHESQKIEVNVQNPQPAWQCVE